MPAPVAGDIPSFTLSELYARGKPRTGVVVERVACSRGRALTFRLFAEEEAVRTVVRDASEPSEGFQRTADVVWVPWSFGSHRPYLLCELCGRRCSRVFIYLDSLVGSSVCRRCAGPRARYTSQNATTLERLQAPRRTFLSQLGVAQATAPLGVVPVRPRGQHRATYTQRLRDLALVDEQLELEVQTEQRARIERLTTDVSAIPRPRRGRRRGYAFLNDAPPISDELAANALAELRSGLERRLHKVRGADPRTKPS